MTDDILFVAAAVLLAIGAASVVWNAVALVAILKGGVM
jgi:hypothetical protein